MRGNRDLISSDKMINLGRSHIRGR